MTTMPKRRSPCRQQQPQLAGLLLVLCFMLLSTTPATAQRSGMQWICPIYYIKSVCAGSNNREDRDRPPSPQFHFQPTYQMPVSTPTAPTGAFAPPPRPVPSPVPPAMPRCSNRNPTAVTSKEAAISQYDITFDFQNVRYSDRNLFTKAAQRWQRVIVGDVQDATSVFGTSRCGKPWPSRIDDVHICAVYQNIDGPAGTLGYARPILKRAAIDAPMTAAGEMVFDAADATGLDPDFLDTIIHEMGHVIGLGTSWPSVGVQPSRRVPCPYSPDSKASKQWQCLTGCTNQPIPVEDTMGNAGSDCGHWRQDCLRKEIMTPFLDSDPPLSSLTVASLEDLGYKVNYNGADPFTADDIHPDCLCNNNRRLLRGGTSNETMTDSTSWPPRRSQRKLTAQQKVAKLDAIRFGQDILKQDEEQLAAAAALSPEDEVTTRSYSASRASSVVPADPVVVVIYRDPLTKGIEEVIVTPERYN